MKDTFEKWAKAALARAVRTFAQTSIAMIGTATLIGYVEWATVLSSSALAALLSILTSLSGLPEVQTEQ